jgi:hypothetical protein
MDVAKWSAMDIGQDERHLTLRACERVKEC